jgi:hypothetical protein
MGNSLKHNIDEAKSMEELKSFLRHFKAEAERRLGLLKELCDCIYEFKWARRWGAGE